MTVSIQELAQRSDIKFGTSGLRGLVENFTDEVCFAYTKAFLLSQEGNFKKVAIGHDLRPSSPRITQACISAIEALGLEAIYCGALPTPAIAYYCLNKKIPGIVVTGSHIPFDRNGIKFYRADGEISKTDEESIMGSDIEIEGNNSTSLPVFDREAMELYQKRYIDFFGTRFLSGKTIAIYQHSSVARDFLDHLFQEMGAKTLLLGRSNEFVPIDTEAVRNEDISQAKQWAGENNFDILVSTDGDADRPLVADEYGEFIRGDLLGALTAQYLEADHVVTPVNSSSAVELNNNFKSITRTKIGSPYVICGMSKIFEKDPLSTIVGYEANGGVLLGSSLKNEYGLLLPLQTRDAVLPMLSFMGSMIKWKLPASNIASLLPNRYTYSDRVQGFSLQSCREFIELVENQKIELCSPFSGMANSIFKIDLTDGVRAFFDTGDIVHFRVSGNAPEIRCYAESDSARKCEKLCNAGIDFIRKTINFLDT